MHLNILKVRCKVACYGFWVEEGAVSPGLKGLDQQGVAIACNMHWAVGTAHLASTASEGAVSPGLKGLEQQGRG